MLFRSEGPVRFIMSWVDALVSYGKFCYQTLVPAGEGDYDMATLGHALLDTNTVGYLLPFEAISVLLLACIIAGVVIARRR